MTAAVAILLHAHVPGIQLWRARHAQGPRVLRALVVAMRDVYLPLLRLLSDLQETHPQGPPRLSLALSPALVEAWDAPELREAFEAQTQADLDALRDALSQRPDGPLHELAASSLRRLEALRDDLRAYQHDLASAFLAHARAGRLALLPSAPTEAPLPLMATHRCRVAHVHAARAWFERRFAQGATSRGFWLPGLAYCPDTARALRDGGAAWTVAPARAWSAERAPSAELWAAASPLDGLAVFPAHPEAQRVPCPNPTDEPAWRDLRADERLSAWPSADWMAQTSTGLLSASRDHLYQPARAVAQAKKQARAAALRWRDLAQGAGVERPLLTLAWSLEQLGARWFEGPVFLRALLHELDQDPALSLTTPDAWLLQAPAPPARRTLGAASAGPDGHAGAWLDPSRAWLQGHARRLERQLVARLDQDQPQREGARSGARQDGGAPHEALRHLMLAQSGDPHLLHAAGLDGGLDLARQRLERAQALLTAADEPQPDPAALLMDGLPTDQWSPTTL